MSWRGQLLTSQKEDLELFGEFNECMAFEINGESRTTVSATPVTLPVSSNRTTLNSEEDVHIYLSNVEKTQPKACILAFINFNHESNGKRPWPLSKELFERVVHIFDLPQSFLTILDTGLATYTSNIISANGKAFEERRNLELVIQQNRAYSAFSMAIKSDPRIGETRVLIFGADTSSLSELFACLSSIPPPSFTPMVIPTVALELQAQSLTRTIKTCQDRIYAIETATGMRQFNLSREGMTETLQDWKALNLVPIVRDLSSFLSRFAFIKMQAETGAYLVKQMTQTSEALTGNAAQESTTLKLKHIESWYLGIAARCRYLSGRTAAQTQTVYCLIASQDTSINTEIARASRDISEASRKESETMRTMAELARRDTDLMIQVAKDSRAVAVATAQDSASMQVIAAVTILFLPATFTATFFSMTFFDFLDDEKPRVSSWCWVYFLVTIALTVVIQIVWSVISKRKKAKITEATTTGL